MSDTLPTPDLIDGNCVHGRARHFERENIPLHAALCDDCIRLALERARAASNAERDELIDLLVELACEKYECHDYAADYGGPVLDSRATTFGTGVIRRLAELGRLEILSDRGRRVIARRKT